MIENKYKTGIALSPRETKFGPVMFSGRILEGLETVSEAGFKLVELSLRTTADINPDQFLDHLDRLNLSVSAVATGQACLFDQLCLGTEVRSQRRKSIVHFKEMASFAKSINSGAVIIGGIRGSLSKHNNGFQENYALGVEAIKECAEWTDSIGIPLLIEPINRYETNWILTAEEGSKILRDIGIESVKLLLDTFHMNIEESNMIETIIQMGNRVGYIHFADNTRQAPGQGHTNFKAILQALETINYDGPIIAEVLPLPDDVTAVKNTAQFWQKLSL